MNAFTLTNGTGAEVRLVDYGARIVSIRVPDRHGRFDNVVFGPTDAAEFLKPNPYFGAVVGRYANRIANGRFLLDGRVYQLANNNGAHHIHGGIRGFDKVAWRAERIDRRDAQSMTFTYGSTDGEEGYPGTVAVGVTYTFDSTNALRIDYAAQTDRATPINLTQHCYFNLSGHGDILDQTLWIDAAAFTPTDDSQIPTGAIVAVDGTPFDFRVPTRIGVRIDGVHAQLQYAGGYDQNFVLNGASGTLRRIAQLIDEPSGRSLMVSTTEPGLQFYTGNRLAARRGALCLETQHFPDSPNHPNFPSTILRPGDEYSSTTIFAFGVTR